MQLEILGAFAGGFIGIVNYAVIQFAAARIERGEVDGRRKPVVQSGRTTKSSAPGLLRKVAMLELILFPVIGYFIGPMVF